MTARRALFVLGVILSWIGFVGLCYQVAIVRDYSFAGLIDMVPDLGFVIAGLILQGQILEPVYVAATAFGIYLLALHRAGKWPWFQVFLFSWVLIEHGFNRFEKWQIGKRLERQASKQQEDPDQDGLIPEYPGAYDGVMGRRLRDLDNDLHTFDG